MEKPVGLVLLVVGVILLVLGINAADSFASQFKEFFTGNPTDKSIWMMIGGAAALLVGLFLAFGRRGKAAA